MGLSFVYPVYNEIDNLPNLLPETRRVAEGMFPDYEVILVDDGSLDGSGPFIDRLAAEHPNVHAVHHGRNRGLGAAIATGLACATKDLVLYMDSDFPVTAEEARAALRQWSPDIDLVIGYRLGRAEGPRREIMSFTYNRLIRWMFGLHVRDVNFAFKLVRRSLLQQMRLRSEGSFIDAELLLEAARLGAHMREVGMRYHARTAGVSTASGTRVVIRILGEIRRYRRRRRAGVTGPATVIVNADDFGLCHAVNEGVAEAFDRGIVTSASLLAPGDAFDEAAALARARPALDLGVHLTLTQTRPLSPPTDIPSLVTKEGRFPPDWRSFLARYLRGGVRRRHIETELRAQIERVRQAGLDISHLDSHQHLHMLPGVLPIVVRLAAEYGVGALRYPNQRRSHTVGGGVGARLRRRAEGAALRLLCRSGRRLVAANGLLVPDDFRGFSEAGAWDEESLAGALSDLDGGLTEIGCHPGADDGIDDELHWGYHWERELRAFTSPEVAAAIEQNHVLLATYRDRLAEAR